MKTILVISLLILLLSVFNGCSKIVYEKELICYKFTNIEISKDVNIRVYKDDVALFKAKNQELKSAIKFYENQNNRYNKECEK